YATRRIPQPDGEVVARGRQQVTVRAEGGGPEPSSAVLQYVEAVPGGDTPEPGGAVIARARPAHAGGVEGDRVYPDLVPGHRRRALAPDHGPQPDDAVIAAGHQSGGRTSVREG